jgi:hypothetical protein
MAQRQAKPHAAVNFYLGNYEGEPGAQVRRQAPAFREAEGAAYGRQMYGAANEGVGQGAEAEEEQAQPRAAAQNYINWQRPARAGARVDNTFIDSVDNYRIKYNPNILSDRGLANFNDKRRRSAELAGRGDKYVPYQNAIDDV